ncbi:hypothetical protein VTH06DRAFT_4730 [Thermothelomyces fergusii]
MASSMKMTTHDTSSAGFHMADFSSFLSYLSDAVTAAWPDRFATRYRKVKVLLMSWERDDLGVEPEARKLEAVFRGLYHYDTEFWKIPSRRSAVELSRKVADLVDEHGREGNLLILYYAGHARPSEQPGGSPVWAASRSRDSPTVSSSILHSFLGEVDCDVLLLHDCPHQPQEGKDAFVGHGVVETLAAAGGPEPTPMEANDGHSFTASLVQELAHAAHTADWLSVVELHRRILNRMQAWTATLSFTDDAYSLIQVDRHTGQPMFEPPRRRTPVHSFQSKKPRTIVLAPLPHQAREPSPDQSLLLLSPPTGQPQSAPATGPAILVTCRLRDQHVDTEKWRQWLLGAPEQARGIQISALFPGFGTVLILELPLAVWDLLPPSPAISFIAYTTGRNHISEFRRALLGSDTDASSSSDTAEHESDDDDDDDDDPSTPGKHHKKTGRARTRPGRGTSERTATAQSRSSLWPDRFENNRSSDDPAEYTPYCLTLAEMQGDGKTSKAARVIRAFVQGADEPSCRYISDEIEEFCAPASFEALSCDLEDDAELVAVVDEPSSHGPRPREHGMKFLTRGQLYEALVSRAMPQLIDTESRSEKRLIYTTNLDPAVTLALAATAPERHALPLRDFVYKHLSLEAGMDVKLHSSGVQGFSLSFHLPFYAWRQDSHPFTDRRRGSGHHGPLRSSRNISFLSQDGEQTQTWIHEAQVSCLIVGAGNRHWTAYGAVDTYHDGGESKHDVRSYQTTQGGAAMDPLTCGRHMADSSVADAREYFLRAMESCVREVKEEWENTGRQVMKALKHHQPIMNDGSRDAQRFADQAARLVDQLSHMLATTVSAWQRFKETDLADYFDLDDNATATAIRNIDADVRDLAALQSALHHQADSLKLAAYQTSNALLTVAVCFLPFTLTALLLHHHYHHHYYYYHSPAAAAAAGTDEQQPAAAAAAAAAMMGGPGLWPFPQPARHYLLASAAVACAAAGVFLVVAHGAAAGGWLGGLLRGFLRAAGAAGAGAGTGAGAGAPRLSGKRRAAAGAAGPALAGGWRAAASHRSGWPWGWTWGWAVSSLPWAARWPWADASAAGSRKGRAYKHVAREAAESEEDDAIGRDRGLPF